MKQTIIPMKADAKVVIFSGGDLYLEGIDQAQFIAAVEDGETFRMKEEAGSVYVRSQSDCKISLPETAIVTIERVNGDCSARNIRNRIIIGRIDGDLNLRSLGGTSIENVGGDCAIRDIANNIEIARIGGDLVVDQTSQLLISNVGGDFSGDNLIGRVESNVGGDVNLSIQTAQVPELNIHARGDITLHLPQGANAVLDIAARGDIEVMTVDLQKSFESHAEKIQLGTGGASVKLNAGGDLMVSDGEYDWHGNRTIFNDFDHDWDEFSHDLEIRIRRGMEKAMHSVNYAGHRADDAAQRAQEKVNRVMQKLDERGILSERDRKYTGFSFEKPSIPTQTVKKQVSEEERMMILKMLQDKKISVEEAENLLKALES